MATLDRWKHLLHGPGRIEFPTLLLQSRDHNPPLVEGRGEVQFTDLTGFKFTLSGIPADPVFAKAQFEQQKLTPYDPLARFRLFGTDTDGVRWILGWTIPYCDSRQVEWILNGTLDGIATIDESDSVVETSSTELLFVIPPLHLLYHLLGHSPFGGGTPKTYETTILESVVRISYDAGNGALSIIATHSKYLTPTHTENWLGEPLRILFGQLIYPRLVARNLGGRRSQVSLRRAHILSPTGTWASLLGHDLRQGANDNVWLRYAELLSLIALARDRKGNPNFESHKITQLYEQIIQASTGTRWVWALTFASTIEALVLMLGRIGKPREDISEKVRRDLVDYIEKATADGRLKRSAINAVNRVAKVSSVDRLRELVSDRVITKQQYDAWYALRNSVMHGSLVSPYSSEEEDGKLLALLEAVHALTIEVLRYSDASPKA